MPFTDLRQFVADLEKQGDLKRVAAPVRADLEVTEICRRVIRAHGPALLFTDVDSKGIAVVGNLFGTVERVAQAIGVDGQEGLRGVGQLLAQIREPRWPQDMGQALDRLPILRRLLTARPHIIADAAVHEVIVAGDDVDLHALPISRCWPGDVAPLLTFGLVITRATEGGRHNIAIYRQQLIGRNRLIMRWLAHRGGAGDYARWRETQGARPFPIAVAIGADPALMVAAVAPIPDTLSEYQFSGLLRGARTVLTTAGNGLLVPANAEIILEGHIDADDEAVEGPFGDHTGYYNGQGRFPVMTVTRLTHRRKPLYHTTYMGRSPDDEPSVLARALNEVFVPLLQQQFPEIVDFYLPPEACSYRLAVVSIRKRYPGHARRIMFGIWSTLRQFTYTKFVIVTDDDIDVRDWQAVIWALVTRADPARDTVIVADTPIDVLDFASPEPGLGGKIGFDATMKRAPETTRQYGTPIVPVASAAVAAICATLGV
ncbi:MAG: UbiD family decarboxylase [Acidiferrobacter sp.]